MKHLRPLFLALLMTLVISALAHAFEARVIVSSFKPDILAEHVPGHLMDNDPATAWVSLGDGAGESVTVRFGLPVRVVRLGIFNGAQGTGTFGVRNRIVKGRVVYPDGREIAFELDDIGGEQIVECDSGEPVPEFEVFIDEVTPKGKQYEHRGVAVSEIKLYLANIPPTEAEIRAEKEAERARLLLEETAPVIRSFLILNTRLDEDALLLYPKVIREKERMNFYLFQEYQKQLGTFDLLRSAQVDVSDITFEKVDYVEPDATVYAKGEMVVTADNKTVPVPVDSDFELHRTGDGWKIVGEKPRKEFDFNKRIETPES
ncbi:NADase-type glycan-binding domain-containing protein [Salidesulfovibrio brasiliensis]|uniref:NADase-type glycan-binding domain-containing protein n=1 Tax=Salidesulfovibrio brasiliensis TaxID=221711 RepID=UPI0006CF899E|nr:hypothetical protein [Salidesulfovibrio brasiliensis]